MRIGLKGHDKAFLERKPLPTTFYIVIEYEYLVHSPDEIISAHPHLTLQQIHDALSYYYENMEEIDGKIKEEQEFVKGLRKVFQGQNLQR